MKYIERGHARRVPRALDHPASQQALSWVLVALLSTNVAGYAGLGSSTGRTTSPEQAAAQSADEARCNDLAASPSDPTRVGPGVELSQVETAKAIEHCQRAALPRAHPRYRYQLGRALYAAKRFEEALVQFRLAAQGPYTPALADLTTMRRAAAQGNPQAEFMLAVTYELGLGVVKDESAAADWYDRAANQGMPDAQFHLARLYLTGTGVRLSAPTAVAWLEKAAASGHPGARSALGSPTSFAKQAEAPPAPPRAQSPPPAERPAPTSSPSFAELVVGVIGALAVVAAVTSSSGRTETRNGQEGEYVCPSGKHLVGTTCYPDRTDIVSCGWFEPGCNVSEPAEWRPKKPR